MLRNLKCINIAENKYKDNNNGGKNDWKDEA